MRARVEQELALLREYYPDVEHKGHAGEDWFLIPHYRFPAGWWINEAEITEGPICFRVGAAYPSGEPYGFCGPAGVNFKGQAPKNTGSPVQPPFEGSWQHFSWAPKGWTPTADVRKGANLLVWARSFGHRLREGA